MPDYRNCITPLRDKNIPIDKHGVRLWTPGRRKLYHPLEIARYGIQLLHDYRITKMNPAYFDRAEVNANWLVKHAVLRHGAMYFPYRFTYRLFGNPRDLMRPPWYSGLAQGTALMLFLRLYEVTGDDYWRTAADATFATFLQRESSKQPWVVPWTAFVDHTNHRRYLWLEEYPKHPHTQVPNGHMYALFAVWEYARATETPAAVAVFDGGATTIRQQIQRFRVRGGISYYSLRVHAQYASYHCRHVWQLKLLTRMTGDPWFANEGRRFGADGRKAHAGCKHG